MQSGARRSPDGGGDDVARELHEGSPACGTRCRGGSRVRHLVRRSGPRRRNGAWAPIAMSATTFGGSAQFAVASILGGGGAPAIVAALLLNLRYLPIGISVAGG